MIFFYQIIDSVILCQSMNDEFQSADNISNNENELRFSNIINQGESFNFGASNFGFFWVKSK